MSRISNGLTAVIKGIFVVVIGYLYLLSIYSTSYVTTSYNDSLEYVYYVRDNTLQQVIVLVITVAAAVVLCQCRGLYEKRRAAKAGAAAVRLLGVIILAALFALLLGWIRATLLFPSADPHDVYFAAVSLVRGDYTQLQKGGYIYIYPNQKGLMLFEAVIYAVVGDPTFGVMMGLNAVSLLILYVLFQKITVLLCGKRKSLVPYVAFLAVVLWLPLSFYVDFVYGNLIGLMLSVLGFWLFLRYLKDYRFRYAAGGALSLAVAVQIKNNYLIAFLAVIVFLLLEAVRARNWKPLLAIAVSAALCAAAGTAVNTCVSYISDTQINSGVPQEAWIAMGLQENTERANGWYNAYNILTYINYDYDTDLTRTACIENIKNSLNYMKEHPDYTLRFWGTKIASQWNDPTFQCFWYYKNKFSYGANIEWASTVFSDNKWLVELLNLFQSQILGGTLLYMLCNWKKISLPQLLLPICFLGGFFFHLMWEAKAQYMFSYFVLLIPYAVLGFYSLAAEITAIFRDSGETRHRRKAVCVIAIMAALICVGAIPTTFAENTWQIEQNSELYDTGQWE
jgi:hypothetical protein